MKLAIFSDLHLGIKQDDPKWHKIAYDWADSFTEELTKRGIKDIIFLGDFFHKRNTIGVNTLDAANTFLQKFKDFNLHMVLGNHDLYYDNEFTTSGVKLFGNFENIKVYTEPTFVRFGTKKTMMCGWGYDPLQFDADILFTHMEINVFRHHDGSEECNNGFKCSELLQHYQLVYTGHFHLRQNKKYARGEVRYPGNPFQQDFSDVGCKKGFEIYDTDTEGIEFVENTVSPRFVCYKLSEIIKKHNFKALKEEIKNSFFKIIIDRNISTQDENELIRLIGLGEPRSIDKEWENGKSFSQDIGEFDTEGFDTRETIKEYVKRMDVPKKDVITDMVLMYYDKAMGA